MIVHPALLLPLLAPTLQAPSDTWWRTEIALEVADKLGGCAVGDLVPERPGQEIAVVSGSGKVFLVARAGDGWEAAELASLPGEMIQCAIGDADPSRPGNELVVVGSAEGSEDSGNPGIANLVYRDAADGAWKVERIFFENALIHAVAVGPGEVFVAGYSGQAHRVARAGDDWRATKIADLPGAGKSIAVHRGQVVVACTDGTLLAIARDDAAFDARPLDRREAGRARISDSPLGVVCSDDDGLLSLVGPGGRVELFQDDGKLRGAVLADLDPAAPGLEAATVGYSKRITLLYRREGGYEARVLLVDSASLHHLAAGDVDGREGPELVTCGYAGRLYVLRCMRR